MAPLRDLLLPNSTITCYIYPMETAVTIDAELLDKAMQVADGQTQRQLIEDALRLFTLRSK